MNPYSILESEFVSEKGIEELPAELEVVEKAQDTRFESVEEAQKEDGNDRSQAFDGSCEDQRNEDKI